MSIINICLYVDIGALAEVVSAINIVRSRWYSIGEQLGISPDQLNAAQSADADKCLKNTVTCWLQRNYDTSRHGLPTWGKLVQVIGSPAGGNNAPLALAMAQQHSVSVQQSTQTHVAQSEHVSQQATSLHPLHSQSPPSNACTSVNLQDHSPQPVIHVSPTVVSEIHPPVQPHGHLNLLKRYVSWFNFEIFTALSSKFLKDNQQFAIIWNSYEEKFKEYFSLHKVVRVESNPTIHGLPEAIGTTVMVVKVEHEDLAQNDHSIFRRALAKALNQSDFFLYLCTVATGCLELRFVIPDFLFDEIFPLNSQQINTTLPNLGITAIHCDRYHINYTVSTITIVTSINCYIL